MLVFKGISLSSGYADGIASIYDFDIERRLEVPRRDIERSEVTSERKRLHDALERSSEDLISAERTAAIHPGLAESASVLSAHSLIAKEVAELVRRHIGSQFVNVEHALESVIGELVNRLQHLDDARLSDREQDIRDVGQRMMRSLSGAAAWSDKPLPPGSVVVARELLPSDAIALAHSGVVAIVSEQGGRYSHTAIMAKSLGVPAISGIPHITRRISAGSHLLVDGELGTVTVEPSLADEETFAKRKQFYDSQAASIVDDERLPCVTQDGVEISLLGNIGRLEEVHQIADHNLGGVGLFRTEFLILDSQQRPECHMQVEIYHRVAVGLENRPMVIRTFDLGGDKLPPFLLEKRSETRGSLHLRGLRFSLAEQTLLDTQLRAILQVAETSDLRILFPMVIGSDDFSRAIAAVHRAADELGVLQTPPIGVMIETPAALFALDEILELADFAAIGTNDLTQYMLAADRDLAEATDDVTAMHPAVLRAIKQVADAAKRSDCPVCVCGEEAGDVGFACLLVGLGIRELSLSPTRAVEVRRALRHIQHFEAKEVADLALRCRSPEEVRELLKRLQPMNSTTNASESRP